MSNKLIVIMLCVIMGVLIGGGAVYYYENASVAPPRVPEPSRAGPSNGGMAEDFSSIVTAVSPSVVNISTVKVVSQGTEYEDDPFFEFFNDFFSPLYDFGMKKRYREQNLGSGVIVSPDGYIITNNHVVAGAQKIKVTLYDKRSFTGEIIGVDPKTDIAVVHISAERLPAIEWGDSDALKVGEFVLAIGNPFGLNHTVTMGIISAVGRADVGIADYEDFIQTDAAINPGNSGGPLVGNTGRLIGINTAIFSKNGSYQGIGFAVPSNMVRLIMEQLIKNGRVIRGWLGVSLQELTPELGEKFGHKDNYGALVSDMMPGSPALMHGLQSGDIILEYNGHRVEGPSDLKNMVARSAPGDSVELLALRNSKKLVLRVTITELPGEAVAMTTSRQSPRAMRDAFAGLSVIELTADIASQLGVGPEAHGVVVSGVAPGSPSADAGLKRGDIIEEIDKARIRTLRDFQVVASTQEPDNTVLMFINRGGKRFFITLQVS